MFFLYFFSLFPVERAVRFNQSLFPAAPLDALFAEHAVVSQDLRRLLQISPRETAFRVYIWLEDGELPRTAVL